MSTRVLGLDHVILAVGALDPALRQFERLGFAATPRGTLTPWGTANHCLMLGDGYLVLLAAEGEGAEAETVRSFVAQRGDGAMAVGLATEDAAGTAARLVLGGLDVPAPRRLTRAMAGHDAMPFWETPLPATATPGLMARLVQPLASERMRQPAWLAHPNGAVGLASVTVVVADPVGLAPAYESVFGPATATATDDLVAVHTGRGLIFLVKPDDLDQLHPEADPEELPTPPAIAALSITVAETQAAAAVLRANGVAFSRDRSGTVHVPPAEACGIRLELLAAD